MRIRINPYYSFWLSGSGLVWCWGFLRFFWSQSMLSESGGSVLGDLPYLGSTLLVSLVIASLASSVLLRKLQTRLATLGCVLLVSGMVLSFAAGMFETNASELQLLSDVAQGGGIGVFFIAWGCVYIRLEAEAVECAFLGWFPLLAALLAVVAGINMLEWGATVLYSCLMLLSPPASLVCFFKSVRHADGHDEEAGLLDGCSRGKEGRPASRRNIVWPLANLVFVFAATSLAWNAFLFRMKINFGAQVAMFAVGIVVLFVIVWLALRMTRHFSLSTLYRWACHCSRLAQCCISFLQRLSSSRCSFACLSSTLGLR